jgi:chromosome segregation ATPase
MKALKADLKDVSQDRQELRGDIRQVKMDSGDFRGTHDLSRMDMKDTRNDGRDVRFDLRDLSKDLRDVRHDVVRLNHDLAANTTAATIEADQQTLRTDDVSKDQRALHGDIRNVGFDTRDIQQDRPDKSERHHH